MDKKERIFNEQVAEDFIIQYKEVTGRSLKFISCGDPFPDVVFGTEGGDKIGVEFVSVVFPWMNQDKSIFEAYQKKFYERIEDLRPALKDVVVDFQPSFQANATKVRGDDAFLPGTSSREGKQILREFEMLFHKYQQKFTSTQSFFINDFKISNKDKKNSDLQFPTLAKYFDALSIISPTTFSTGFEKVRPHEDDPLLLMRVFIYHGGEVSQSIIRVLNKKFDPRKGSSYSAEILLLHTISDDFPGLSTQGDEIVKCGKEIARHIREDLKGRFGEIWFLSRHRLKEGRLFRLA